MIRITNKALNEIIRDFLRSGLELSIESFKEWAGVQLQEDECEYVGNRIYELI
jgi:hypothetical protein